MNSKEALEKISWRYVNDPSFQEWCNTIKQDLDRLEKVEKDLKQTKSNFKNSQTHSRNCYKKILDRYMGLEKENVKLKKVIDKACERLDYTCPIEEELVEDLDCDDCDNDCKECWKKYFMCEVLVND